MTYDSGFFKGQCVSVSKKVTWKTKQERISTIGFLRLLGALLVLPIWFLLWTFDD